MATVARRAQAHQQYNTRPPARPEKAAHRKMSHELSAKREELKLPDLKETASPKPSRASSTSSAPQVRRIATNSRLRQREQNQRDGFLAFANDALQRKANGIEDEYNELVDQFDLKKTANDASSPTPRLRLWLMALSHVVSRLDKQHSTLVQGIIDLPWTIMESNFVQTYINFIGILVSARPEYLTLILAKIAQGFTYQYGLQALDGHGAESSTNPLTRKDVYDRLHCLLEHLLDLVPTLPAVLEPLLVRNLPHKRQKPAALITYIRNLLRLSEYCPALAEKILSLIVERALQIDVEIQIELEELEERLAEEGQDSAEVFDIDPFDTVVGAETDKSDDEDGDDEDDFSDISSEAASISDGEEKVPSGMDLPHVQDMVNKLDSILKIIFEHFSASHLSDPPVTTPRQGSPTSRTSSPARRTSSPDPIVLEQGRAARRAQFTVLLSIFDRTILRTFKSRHTQFLLFWYASLDPSFSDAFQGMLIERALLDARTPAVERAAATVYLASFVSRAKFVGRDNTRDVVGLFCKYMEGHLDVVDEYLRLGSTLPASQHGNFFAVAQACFLIFCFRWRDLLEGQDQDGEEYDGDASAAVVAAAPGKTWMPGLGIMQRVVTSTLNPLRVCSPNVVQQFARIAHQVGFLYVYSILEANRRAEFAGAHGKDRLTSDAAEPVSMAKTFIPDGMHAELNTFFPFDPYNLPKSGAWIHGVYRDWASVAIDGEDEDEDEDEDHDHEQEDPVADDDRQVLGAAADSSGDLSLTLGSFEDMSISPVRRCLPVSVT